MRPPYCEEKEVDLLHCPRPEDLLELLPPDGPRITLARSTAAWVEGLDDEALSGIAIPIADVRDLLVPTKPEQILLLAGNYAARTSSSGGEFRRHAERVKETFPYVFMKPASTTLTDPFTGTSVVIPSNSPDHIDWECELGVVIGRECRGVAGERGGGLRGGLHDRERHQRP